MEKRLESGAIVDNDEFYNLLDWKDHNMKVYILWLDKHNLPPNTGIRQLGQRYYDELLKLSKS